MPAGLSRLTLQAAFGGGRLGNMWSAGWISRHPRPISVENLSPQCEAPRVSLSSAFAHIQGRAPRSAVRRRVFELGETRGMIVAGQDRVPDSRRMLPRPKTCVRTLILLIAVLAIAGFVVCDAGEYLSLASLRATANIARVSIGDDPALLAAGFFIFYLAAAGLSVPGTIISSVMTGAVFGVWPGLLVASLGITCGSGIAFLGSRYLFRNWAERKLEGKLKGFVNAAGEDGIFALLALRLNPAVPYFLVNWCMGLTHMRILTFLLVSYFGKLPVILIYVDAGARLSEIREARDIMSPTTMIALALLSGLTFAFKPTGPYFKSRQARPRSIS